MGDMANGSTEIDFDTMAANCITALVGAADGELTSANSEHGIGTAPGDLPDGSFPHLYVHTFNMSTVRLRFNRFRREFNWVAEIWTRTTSSGAAHDSLDTILEYVTTNYPYYRTCLSEFVTSHIETMQFVPMPESLEDAVRINISAWRLDAGTLA